MKAFAIFVTAMLVVSTAKAADRPNIVFIMSDDHGYQAISAYGDSRKLNQTPNVDRIANEGMRFDRCLVTNSICGPSRAAILTGKYSHANGFYNNEGGQRFDGSQTTFPKLLQSAGYQTALVGKWHLVSDPTGFDHWNILTGQGVYYNPTFIQHGERRRHDGYVTDLTTDFAIDWLNQRDRRKPFMLMVHHKAPHRDWQPAVRHLGHDNDRQHPIPATLFDDYKNRGSAVAGQDMTIAKTMTPNDLKFVGGPRNAGPMRKAWDEYYTPRNEAFRKANLQGHDLVRWKYNRYLHDYLGCVASVDESVGRLLKHLDDHDLAKNTIVVYTSDQGFYLGEHGWFDKRWIFEESLRTPLLVRWPSVVKPKSVNADIVSNVDFAATFLEAAHLKPPSDLHGRSIVPVLKGQTPGDWRKSFYYHYYEYPGSHSVRKHYGVVTDRYKLVHFYEPGVDYWELFDRKTDPQETKSVFAVAEYSSTKKELEAELARLRSEFKVPAHDPPESTIKPKPEPAK